MIRERFHTYNGDACWQYNVRVMNLDEDLANCGLTLADMKSMRVSDFSFSNISDKSEKRNIKKFIERHEWLGNLSQYTTHWFACYYNNILSGAILFNMPNAFSKILGENTKNLERLISRGACISWSPKNLASSFLMWCMRWMVENTQYRLFTAYSDPTARELGTIYQACNFYYMGQSSGATTRYVNPYTGKIVSDRYFRQKTAYKKFANEMGIEWCKEWSHKTGMNWHNVPDDIELLLRKYSKKKQEQSKKILIPPKHKYAYVLGKNKRETKRLRGVYEERNKVYPYPKDRGK